MKKTIRNFMFMILVMPSMAFAICNPFTAGPLSASALNNALASPCITSGTITGSVITNTPISGSTGSFTTLSASNSISTPSIIKSFNIIAASGVAINGYSYAVNTSSVPVTITLPASSASATVTLLDYAGTFATNNMTVQAPTGVNINGSSGSPAALTVSTSWIKIICTYLDSTIGYRCYQ